MTYLAIEPLSSCFIDPNWRDAQKRSFSVARITEEIRLANEFGDKIEDLVLARREVPHGERNTLLMAYWSLACELHRAILSWIERQFYGAAFALVRPILEATIRA